MNAPAARGPMESRPDHNRLAVFMEKNTVGSQNILLIMSNVAGLVSLTFSPILMLDGLFVTLNRGANFRLQETDRVEHTG